MSFAKMTEHELREYIGPVWYRPFADVIPARGVYGGLTRAGWALVWFDGKDEPEEVEPWCLTLADRNRDSNRERGHEWTAMDRQSRDQHLRHWSPLQSTGAADYGSEGWGFESLRARHP